MFPVSFLLKKEKFTQFHQCYFSKYFSVAPNTLPGISFKFQVHFKSLKCAFIIRLVLKLIKAHWPTHLLPQPAAAAINKYPLEFVSNFGSKFCSSDGLVTAAVNESISKGQSLEESCISWICDANTIMRQQLANGSNIREHLFLMRTVIRIILGNPNQQKRKLSSNYSLILRTLFENERDIFTELILLKKILWLILGRSASSLRRRTL